MKRRVFEVGSAAKRVYCVRARRVHFFMTALTWPKTWSKLAKASME
jgi:hypothetical protein